jgi:exodeoxyribonuclease VII small subunit
MAVQKNKADISKMTFEQAIDTLTEIVDGIEAGQMPLQESIDNYEKGMTLIKHCRTILQAAEKKIEKIATEKGAQENI